VELLKATSPRSPEVLVLHANAVLTPRQRLRLARLVVEDNWPKSRAAEFFGVAWKTADRWAERYRTLGKAGMADRSSRPHASPARTDPATTKRLISLRLRKRWGPVRLAAETGVAPSTAGAVLRRCGVSRLSVLDRRERVVARYEHPAPGELLHADVKKLGNIPAGGGWRFLGREQGGANRHRDGGRARSQYHNPLMRHGFIHVVLDDHSRLAYAEIHDDELGVTATASCTGRWPAVTLAVIGRHGAHPRAAPLSGRDPVDPGSLPGRSGPGQRWPPGAWDPRSVRETAGAAALDRRIRCRLSWRSPRRGPGRRGTDSRCGWRPSPAGNGTGWPWR
jgi:hypothetical protein